MALRLTLTHPEVPTQEQQHIYGTLAGARAARMLLPMSRHSRVGQNATR